VLRPAVDRRLVRETHRPCVQAGQLFGGRVLVAEDEGGRRVWNEEAGRPRASADPPSPPLPPAHTGSSPSRSRSCAAPAPCRPTRATRAGSRASRRP
jgi:hypothetical protein